MGHIDEVRTLIRATELPEALTAPGDASRPWSADRLARSFSYQIELVGKRIKNEHAVPLGSSKVRGLPHLPRGMAWPKGLYFAAQINLDHLARVDRSGWLPRTGMLYFFIDDALQQVVIHWSGSIEGLTIREYPDASTLPDADRYLEAFLRGETVNLEPYGLFRDSDGGTDDHTDLYQRLPDALFEKVSNKLGARIEAWDSWERLYGTPLFKQDEDDDIIGFDDEGQPIWRRQESRLLLLQTEFGDATVHFMCGFEAAAKGDFSGVEVTASMT